MRAIRTNKNQESEKGVALLISIFALMLISAVAISLVLMSGTGSAIDSNYRNSTKAFYNAAAGLEEVRGRLAPGRATTILNLLPNAPNPMLVSPTVQVQYIVNPAPGDNVTPTVAGSKYADTEFAQEWGSLAAATEVVAPNINSDFAAAPGGTLAGLNGPQWKWVRITGLTEASSGNVQVDGDGLIDSANPIFYATDPISGTRHRFVGTAANLLLPQFANASQVLRLTSLSVLPDGSRRMLQYDVTMNILNFNLPSPLTMPGTIKQFKGATSTPYKVNGTDGSGTAPAVPGCTPNPNTSLPAIGTTDASGQNTNQQTVVNGIPSNRYGNYTGGNPPPPKGQPSVSDVTLTSPFDNPADLDNALQTIQQNANVNLGSPPAPGNPPQNYTFSNVVSSMPSGTWSNTSPSCTGSTTCSADNPQIVYVDGNFDLGPNTGSGILVVTGNFTYQGNSGWNGLVLIVGEGTTTFLGNGGGSGQFDGGIFVATTKDSQGNQLSSFGQVNYDITGGGGNGIYYNSCWINNSTNSLKKFQELSFREILNF
ncbi:MAG TPA: pilus assembly PilX N-terminal domain-containing protein [Candidatus Acidoferrales bacterium]|nr:pilus assembly PilX N-terminal domain-containing protein [Candidatus Acidoferrales bacterium]